MNSVHRIRLRGLWELESSSGSAGPVRKVRLPANFSDVFPEAPSKICLARRFHCPTNLERHDEVALIVAKLPGLRNVTLNGYELQMVVAHQSESRCVITPCLKPANLLRLEVEVDTVTAANLADQVCGEVALEIRSSESE